MIVITAVTLQEFHVCPGDTFTLSVSNYPNGEKIVITEKITKTSHIDYMCSYQFCNEDGSCNSFNLNGFFGQKDNLPIEIQNAKYINDLTKSQKEKFLATSNTQQP